jgi:hypothetical protein
MSLRWRQAACCSDPKLLNFKGTEGIQSDRQTDGQGGSDPVITVWSFSNEEASFEFDVFKWIVVIPGGRAV